MDPVTLLPDHPCWPARLSQRLGEGAPAALYALGPTDLLGGRLMALFCSARAPGSAILPALDAAVRLRDEGVTVIGGYHSPLERECLSVLLRGRQPVIVCPGRALDGMRVAGDVRRAFEAGRLLYLSPFTSRPRRVTRESAARRNEVVAALADAAHVVHVTPGGETARVVDLLRRWGVPLLCEWY